MQGHRKPAIAHDLHHIPRHPNPHVLSLHSTAGGFATSPYDGGLALLARVQALVNTVTNLLTRTGYGLQVPWQVQGFADMLSSALTVTTGCVEAASVYQSRQPTANRHGTFRELQLQDGVASLVPKVAPLAKALVAGRTQEAADLRAARSVSPPPDPIPTLCNITFFPKAAVAVNPLHFPVHMALLTVPANSAGVCSRQGLPVVSGS